jgi:hypothetical protein
MRAKQSAGIRGSLKWIQRAVNEQWPTLNHPIAKCVGDNAITWLSPLATDDFAEYRDSSFLTLIGQSQLIAPLKTHWPSRGPQWDALGKTSRGDVLLVEAKAHIAEMCSPGTAASGDSRTLIDGTLALLAQHLDTNSARAPWTDYFYQLANRLAHLHFLREHGVPSWLVLVNFVGDDEMRGPATSETWEAAYEVAFHAMGLRKRHALSPFIIHVYPSISDTAISI